MKNPIYIENLNKNNFKINLSVYNDDSYDMSFEEDFMTISDQNKCIYVEISCIKFDMIFGSETSDSFLVDRYGVERFVSEGLRNDRFTYEIDLVIEKSIKKLKMLHDFYTDNFLIQNEK